MILSGGMRADQSSLQVELIFLRDGGFAPAQIHRSAGPFLLTVLNRTAVNSVALQLVRQADKSVVIAPAPGSALTRHTTHYLTASTLSEPSTRWRFIRSACRTEALTSSSTTPTASWCRRPCPPAACTNTITRLPPQWDVHRRPPAVNTLTFPTTVRQEPGSTNMRSSGA